MSTSDVDQRSTDVTVLEKNFSDLEFKYKHKRQQLEQQKSVLIIKDLLNTNMTSPIQKTLQVPCQYCGSVDHRLNTCLQAIVCPACQVTNHRPLYICLLQQPRKNKEKDSKSCNKSNPFMGNSKISYKENLENVQECPVVAMNNSVLGPIKITLQP